MPADSRLIAKLQKHYNNAAVRYLAGGSFGQVYKIYPLFSNSIVVKLPIDKSEAKNALLHEIDVMRALPQSPYLVALLNVVKLRQWWQAQYQIGCEMPYYEGGDLNARLQIKRLKQSVFSPSELSKTMAGVLTGLAVLHEHGVIHRDIKPDNIFFKDDGFDHPVIGDFGLAINIPDDSLDVEVLRAGSPQYMPPEVLKSIYKKCQTCKISTSSDVYAAMWMLVVLWHLGYPLNNENPEQNIRKHAELIYLSQQLPNYNMYCQPQLAGQVEAALQHLPANRPSAKQLSTLLREKGEQLFTLPLTAADLSKEAIRSRLQQFASCDDVFELVGEGGFAAVFRCADQTQVYKVASMSEEKRAHLQGRPGDKVQSAIKTRITALQREIKIFEKLQADEQRCDSIVSFLGAIDLGGVPAMQLSYVAGKELDVYFFQKVNWQTGSLQEIHTALSGLQSAFYHVFLDIANALCFLHEKSIVHRDLGYPNVLVEERGGQPHACVIDFGSAVEVGQSVDPLIGVQSDIMTPEHVAAEDSCVQIIADPAQDIYAFGALLLGVLVGYMPHDISKAALKEADQSLSNLMCHMQAVKQGVPKELGIFSGRAHDFVAPCLALNPADRPAASTLRDSICTKRGALFSLCFDEASYVEMGFGTTSDYSV